MDRHTTLVASLALFGGTPQARRQQELMAAHAVGREAKRRFANLLRQRSAAVSDSAIDSTAASTDAKSCPEDAVHRKSVPEPTEAAQPVAMESVRVCFAAEAATESVDARPTAVEPEGAGVTEGSSSRRRRWRGEA